MPTQTLTADFLASLPARVPNKGSVLYFDTEIKGFALEHRASGSATFYYRYRDLTGRVRMNRIATLDASSLDEARTKAYQMRQMVQEGGDPALERHRFRDLPTLAQFVAESYLPYAKSRKRSWDTDERLLRLHILPRLGDLRMNRITRPDVIALHQATTNDGYAAATCNRILILLKFIYNCAIRWDVLPKDCNPCRGIKLFQDNGARERYLTPAEIQALLDEIKKSRSPLVGTIIQVLLYTGARKREILDARWENIDFDRQILTVPVSKSGKPRHIALSDGAIALLRSVPRTPGVPWVFANPKTGKPFVSIFQPWSTIRRKAGIPDVRLHDLRHSFASFLVSSGRSLYEVQTLLGHHDPKMTMRYAHLSPSALVQATSVVDGVMARQPAAFPPEDTAATG